MKSYVDYLRECDIISGTVGIRYKGEWRYKTLPGAILSLLFFALGIGILIFFSIQFINRESMNMVTETIRLWNPEPIDLTNFKFAVGLSFGNEHKFRHDIINITFKYIEVNTTTQEQTVRIQDGINCNPNDFNAAESQYRDLEIKDFLCMDTSNLIIKGQPINQFYSYVKISFSLCQNSTSVICQSPEKIYEILESVNVQATFYYLGSAFQFKNRNQFVLRLINSIPTSISHYLNKDTNIYFANNLLSVQNGYIFDTPPQNIYEIMLDSTRDVTQYSTQNKAPKLNFNIFSSRIVSNTFLSYMQFSQLIANLGGILNGSLVICNMIIYYLNNTIYHADFIQKIYRINNKSSIEVRKKIFNIFDEIKQSRNLNEVNPSDTKEIKVENSNLLNLVDPTMPRKLQLKILEDKTQVSEVYKQTNNDKNNITEDLKTNDKFKSDYFKTKNFEVVDFYPYDIVKLTLCPCFVSNKSKTNIFDLINGHLEHTQDFFNIFKKIIEIDLIKHLIFDKDQLHVLRFLLKPEVLMTRDTSEHDNKDSFSKYFNDNQSHFLKDENYLSTIRKEEKDQLINSLRNIMDKTTKTEIDEKILKNLKKAFN